MLEFHQAQNEQAKKKQRIRLPITKREYVHRLLEYYHPAVKPVAHSEHRIHRVYPITQNACAGLPMAVVATGLTYFYLEEYALLILFISAICLFSKYRLPEKISVVYIALKHSR